MKENTSLETDLLSCFFLFDNVVHNEWKYKFSFNEDTTYRKVTKMEALRPN